MIARNPYSVPSTTAGADSLHGSPATSAAAHHRVPQQSRTDSLHGSPATSAAAHHRVPQQSRTDSLSAGADSVVRMQGDTLRLHGDSVCFMQGDSLIYARIGGWPDEADSTQAGPWRDTTASALFGGESCTVQPAGIERPIGESLTDNAVFQGFVLLLAATYATLLYRNLGDVKTLLSRIFRDTASSKRITDEPGSNGFTRFLNVTTAIGMLFMGVIVVKYGDTLLPSELGRALSHGAVLALSLLATLAWCGVVIFQTLLFRITGAVTLSQPFISQLNLLRRTFFALGVIITSPTLLLFALCPRGTGGAWFIVGAVELIITAVLYLRESLNLFISKKISILLWILYLCTVEIFPISLLWLLVARS